jgi:hypothetical protein
MLHSAPQLITHGKRYLTQGTYRPSCSHHDPLSEPRHVDTQECLIQLPLSTLSTIILPHCLRNSPRFHNVALKYACGNKRQVSRRGNSGGLSPRIVMRRHLSLSNIRCVKGGVHRGLMHHGAFHVFLRSRHGNQTKPRMYKARLTMLKEILLAEEY